MSRVLRRHGARWLRAAGVAVVGVVATSMSAAQAATTVGSLSFTLTPLTVAGGNSEPEIASAANGSLGMVALDWNQPATNLWTGPFGSVPTFQGSVDTTLRKAGATTFGGGDADVDQGSTGTLHITDLDFFQNKGSGHFTLGVSAITCPNGNNPASFSLGACTAQILDTAGVDRPWITSDGMHVWISYHDSGNSSLIHVQRSDDDGLTWRKVADPVVGQAQTTGDATFNNVQGPLVADPSTHTLYDIYAAGERGELKGRTFTPDRVIVSKSTDGGSTWAASTVFHMFTAPNQGFGNVFPSLAADPTNGDLDAVWSDGHTVWLSTSTNQAGSWSSPVAVSTSSLGTALMPWPAAFNGTLDIVYYGTSATSNMDPTADWFVYMAQSTDGGATFTQSQVNSTTNHVGVVCTGGTSCGPGTRNLLDLFQVAIDPANGKAAIIYTDDTMATTPAPNFSCTGNQDPCPLPEAVLAQQN